VTILTAAGTATRPERATDPAPAVAVRGFSKRFAVRRPWLDTLRHPLRRDFAPVVQNVSLEIRPREFFGLLGPNGAGKSTFFRMLSTAVLPDAGSATVIGFDVVRQPREVRRVLACVTAEERSLNWRLSARENLRLFASLYGLRGAERTQRIDEVLETVQLTDAGEKMVARFSSGMRQRLLIGRALLDRPAVLLLDEPTRSLDPVSARRFRTFLREELVGRQGCTVLLATHNSEEAFELCDRIAILDRGRLLAVGTAARIAAEMRGERYHVWTRTPEHPAFAALEARGRMRVIGAPRGDREAQAAWTPVEVGIEGGPDAAAGLLDDLLAAGVPVSRFEECALPLADLIEEVVTRHGGEGTNA
jgi:ABC-2 type transport system ATP-binding protein